MGSILEGLAAVFGIYGALYIGTAIGHPNWFLSNLSVQERSYRHYLTRRDEREPAKPRFELPLAFATMIAVGVVFYGALGPLFSIVPDGWWLPGEEGEEGAPAEIALRMSATLWAALALCPALEKNAIAVVEGHIRRPYLALFENLLDRMNEGRPLDAKECGVRLAKLAPIQGEKQSYEWHKHKDFHHWLMVSFSDLSPPKKKQGISTVLDN